MNLTSDGKRMLDWAQKNNSPERCRRVFTPIDNTVASYYEKREKQTSLICEYDFEDFLQVKDCLEELWQEDVAMKEMILISSVSAMKHKPVEESGQVESVPYGSRVSDGEYEIPEYVYVF